MLLNEILSKTLGFRLIREKHLEDMGFYAQRDEIEQLNAKAAQVLHTMTSHNGKSLTPALKKKADEYAVEVLGSRDHAPWLYAYSTMQGKFRDGWMPESFYHRAVVPRIAKDLGDISAMKSFSNILFRTNALPDLAYSIDGMCYDRDYRMISRAELTKLAQPHGSVFIKGDGGGAGNKIQRIGYEALADHAFSEDCVVQSAIQPHPFFDEFVSGAVATLRINTAKTQQGSIEMRGARLRFGRSESAWLTSDKSVKVSIMDDDGTLDEFGYTPDWRAWPAHPDTGVPFAGRKVPAFAKAVELCRSLHAKLPHFALIGWDAAINREGKPELIEWNTSYTNISFQEALNGPHFADMGWEKFAKQR